MAINRKSYQIRFYDVTGYYLGMPSDVSFGGFRKVINGGLGDLSVDLPLPFAESYASPYTTPGNRVTVTVMDQDTASEGVLIYSGFVIERAPHLSASAEGVTLLCRGHTARFPFLPLKSGNTTLLRTNTAAGLTTGGTASAATLDTILAAIISRYNIEAVYPVVQTAPGSLESTAVTLTYAWNTKTIQYVIDDVMQSAPATMYWRVGADNILRFKTRHATPDHYLTIGRHVTEISDRETLDGLVNRAFFAYGGLPTTAARLVSDTQSSDRYGDWWDFRTDGRYSVEANVLNVSQSLVDAKKAPPRRVLITVPDNDGSAFRGYDIEKLEPGDTVRLLNLPPGAQEHFPSIYQIVAVDYTLAKATVELETLQDDLSREVALQERQVAGDALDDSPGSYVG